MSVTKNSSENDFVYSAPPILEAAAELRFVQSLTNKQFNDVRKALTKSAHHSEEQTKRNVNIDFATGDATFTDDGKMVRFSNRDQTDIVILLEDRIIISRMAPYESWRAFKNSIDTVIDVLEKKVSKKVSRVGLRYINRLDLREKDHRVEHEEFVNLYIKAPEEQIPGFDIFELRFHTVIDGCDVVVNSARVPCPIPNHVSISLDIDVYKRSSRNWKISSCAGELAKLRKLKNFLFEGFVTDKARELFSD